jgi:putative FmdB family regulatory protein
MPTYEFRCPSGHEFERFHKTMSAAPMELPCPECGAVASRQMSGGAGLVFKGSGFYLTDYGKNAHRGGAPEKQGDGAKEGAKADGVKSEGGKSDGGKTEGGKAEGGKSESASAKSEPKGGEKRSESAKRSGESSAPATQSPTPKTESPKHKKSE